MVRHRFTVGFRVCDSAYVSYVRSQPDSYRFKVRDRFSAYTTCLVRIEHLSEDNF